MVVYEKKTPLRELYSQAMSSVKRMVAVESQSVTADGVGVVDSVPVVDTQNGSTHRKQARDKHDGRWWLVVVKSKCGNMIDGCTRSAMTGLDRKHPATLVTPRVHDNAPWR